MASLAADDKEAIRYHLAYTEAVPDGDRALLEDRMNTIPTLKTVGRFQTMILLLDTIESYMEPGNQTTGIRSKRILLGDVNRTDVEYTADNPKQAKKDYLWWTDHLALKLGVPNYQNPEFWANRYFALSAGKLATVPAAADLYLTVQVTHDLILYYA